MTKIAFTQRSARRDQYAVQFAEWCRQYGVRPADAAVLLGQLGHAGQRIKAYEQNRTDARRARMQSEVVRCAELARQHGFTVTWPYDENARHTGAYRIKCNGFGIPVPTH